jgi:hypothetical protein
VPLLDFCGVEKKGAENNPVVVMVHSDPYIITSTGSYFWYQAITLVDFVLRQVQRFYAMRTGPGMTGSRMGKSMTIPDLSFFF